MKRLLSADRDWNQYFDMLTRLSEPELWEPEPEKLLGSAKLPELLARSQFYRLDNCRIYIDDTIQRNITHLVKKNTQFNVKIFNKSEFFSTFIFKSIFDFYRQHKTGVFQFAANNKSLSWHLKMCWNKIFSEQTLKYFCG